MPVKFKSETEMLKFGLALDPSDPSKAMAARNMATLVSNNAADPGNGHSITRDNTLKTQTGEISALDDHAIDEGIRTACAAIRELEVHFPDKYHQLGTFIIEGRKRFGDENLLQIMREEGIDKMKMWRAERIATLYYYEEAVKFPSLRAILKTIPQTQPRKKKPVSAAIGGGNGQSAFPQMAIGQTAPEQDAEGLPLEPDFVMTEADEDAFNTFVEATGGMDRAAQVFQAGRRQREEHSSVETFERTFVEV
jgi:hypothetical protein